MIINKKTCILIASVLYSGVTFAADPVNIGLNYPKTQAYWEQGLAQIRGALLAQDEINAAGGILGHPVNLVAKNSASKVDRAVRNVQSLIKKDKVKMIFGGSSSAVAIAASEEAKRHNTLYFGTLTYSNATTGKKGHTHMFRESNNAWMAAKALSKYLNTNHKDANYYYVTADYTWGWSTADSMRQFTNTQDTTKHPQTLVKFPDPSLRELRTALENASKSGASVLILSQFGIDMSRALKIALQMNLKEKMTIIVPSLTLGMAKAASPLPMEDIIGTLPWAWQVPYTYNYPKGKAFVEKFTETYSTHPSTSAASAYSILHQYKDAVERAKSFDTQKVIKALEGHSYELLKDTQTWRALDHQNVQTVYVVKGKKRAEVIKDQYSEDFFEIIDSLDGPSAVKTPSEWKAARQAANVPTVLK